MRSKWLLVMLALAGALMSGAALARSSVHLGFYVGPGFWQYPPLSYHYPPYYYYPPYYPPYYLPAPLPPAAPPAYVEQNAPPPPAQNWWYYCAGSKAYYPYVGECPGGWQRVSPTPPDAK